MVSETYLRLPPRIFQGISYEPVRPAQPSSPLSAACQLVMGKLVTGGAFSAPSHSCVLPVAPVLQDGAFRGLYNT